MLQDPSAIRPHGTGTKHLVQLFDSEDSLTNGVAHFFRDGLHGNDQMLAVMDEERWNAVAMRLAALGSPVDDALRCGRFMTRNAKDALKKFMVRDRPNASLFSASVGALVSSLESFGRPLRIYGEMVDVLAARGEYASAHELEQLWNQLGQTHSFTLFCGYTAGHFGDPRNAGDLRRICASHGEVLSNPEDVLGSFLLSHRAAS